MVKDKRLVIRHLLWVFETTATAPTSADDFESVGGRYFRSNVLRLGTVVLLVFSGLYVAFVQNAPCRFQSVDGTDLMRFNT